MRLSYIVSYDISNPRRLRNVFRTVRGYGDPLQLSVFRCELDRRERTELEEKLRDIIDQSADQILFIDLGPVGGRAAKCIRALGRPYLRPERSAIVI